MSDLIERVVIQLDAASETRDAIDTAARLAARAKAPLQGIFVDDEDLLRFAILPFARQVSLGAGSEPLTLEHVEWHLRVAAERVRLDLAAAAKRHGVAWSFEVMRGSSVGPDLARQSVIWSSPALSRVRSPANFAWNAADGRRSMPRPVRFSWRVALGKQVERF